MPMTIVRDNIAAMRVDAVVNAANSRLQAGGGVCGAIFEAAGRRELQAACDQIGHCDEGHAVLTPGFRLPAKYVIHAVGPVWRGGRCGEERALTSAYARSLDLARSRGLTSVAFPLISSGIYGYPKPDALRVAVNAIGSFLLENDMDVYLVVFDREAYRLSEKLFASIRSYIDDRCADAALAMQRNRQAEAFCPATTFCGARPDFGAEPLEDLPLEDVSPEDASLEDVLAKRSDTFSQAVLRLIDERGEADAAVYKRANLDRKLFSKLRTDPRYRPSKPTAVALAVALRLDLEQTRQLLARAGYALSPCDSGDMIVSFFIGRGEYDIFAINAALFAFNAALLGAG